MNRILINCTDLTNEPGQKPDGGEEYLNHIMIHSGGKLVHEKLNSLLKQDINPFNWGQAVFNGAAKALHWLMEHSMSEDLTVIYVHNKYLAEAVEREIARHGHFNRFNKIEVRCIDKEELGWIQDAWSKTNKEIRLDMAS